MLKSEAAHLSIKHLDFFFNILFFPCFQPQLVEDFRALRKTAEDMKLFRGDPVFFSLYLGHIIVMEILAWLMVSYCGTSWSITFVLSIILTVSQVRFCLLNTESYQCSVTMFICHGTL